MGGFAWVTLATNDSYSLGALVLAHSLRKVNTAHQLAVLVTPGVTSLMREKLASVFNIVKEVNILDSRDEANLRLLKRPELGITFTKLHCWRLTQFDKCVFLDADTMVLENADELFDREEFSAAPDVGWPDCFNSGVFVYRPSEETYSNLVQFALEKGSFDGGDQGLLNLYFSDWAHKDISKHLPFIYNMCSTACYSYLPAFKQFGGNVKIIHFIGNSKPWLQYFDSETQHVQVISDIQHLQGVVQQWWNIFCSCIHPMLSPEMAPSRAPATFSLPFYPSTEHTFHHNSRPNSPSDKTHNINKSDYVFDPWEAYEELIDNPENQSQQIDSKEYLQQNENLNVNTSVPNSIDSHQNSSSTFITSNDSTESFQPNTNNSNVSIVDHVESHYESPISHSKVDYSSTPPSQVTSHIPPEQPFRSPSPQPTISESYAVIDPSIECEQHARPHTCEPSSSVTNESALHESNEVHESNAGLAGAFARLTLGSPRTPEQAMLEDQLRKQGWEVGNIDYMGRDSFDNIWSKICETLSAGPEPAQSSPTAHVEEPASAAPIEETKQAISETIHIPVEKPAEVTPVQKEEALPTSESTGNEVKKPQVESVTDSITPPVSIQSSENTQTQTSISASTPTQAETQSQQSSIPLQEILKPEIKETLPTPETPKSVTFATEPLESFIPASESESDEIVSTPESSGIPSQPTTQLPEPISCPVIGAEPPKLVESFKPISTSDSQQTPSLVSEPSQQTAPIPVSEVLEQKVVIPLAQPTTEPKPSMPDSPKSAASLKLSQPAQPTTIIPDSPASPEPTKSKSSTPDSSKPVAPQQSESSKPKPSTPESPKPVAPLQLSELSEQKSNIPESPKSVSAPSSQSPKQVPVGKASAEPAKQVLKTEPEKSSESSKSKAEPAGKASTKSAPVKTADSSVQEQSKTSAPKVSTGASSPQKSPQSPPAKEASDEGPTPPPRKSAGGGAAAGKKGGKGKK